MVEDTLDGKTWTSDDKRKKKRQGSGMFAFLRFNSIHSVVLSAAVLAGAFVLPVAAQPFEVVEPEVEKGEFEIEVNGAVQTGLPEGDDDEEAVRHAHELAVGYGLTDFLKIEAGVTLEKEVGEDLQATNFEVEATLELLEQEESGFGLGFFAAIEPRIDDEATDEFEFGPIFAFALGGVQNTANTFFEKSFGKNREEGWGFAYAWQSKVELEEGLGIGIEAFGEVEDIGEDPPVSEQEHRLGPVVYYDMEVGEDREIGIAFGVLFGLTEATPDVAFKWNVELEL